MSILLISCSSRVLSCVSLAKLVPRCLPCTSHPVRYFGQPAPETHPHLVQAGEVTPGISQEEYKTRRFRLMENVAKAFKTNNHKDHIVIIPSSPKTYMTHDIPYPFRQNTDFLYLCGFQEPDSVLVLESTAGSLPDHRSILFVPKKDPHREMWDGPRSGREGAVELTGTDTAYDTDDFEHYLHSYAKDHRGYVVWYNYIKPSHSHFHFNYITDFLRLNKVGFTENPKSLIQALRLIKSQAEIKLMQKTCDIASDAFQQVMKYSYPGVNESHLYAKMDFECRVHEAEMLAYPPVVAGGNRANTIHYINNNQIIEAGDLVLMDAGCECHGYTSDITRTWPVSGLFSSEQRDLYEAVLEVQQRCVQMCGHHGVTMDFIFLEMFKMIGEQLQRLGVVDKNLNSQQLQRISRQFCPHHVGHYLGMDVHDTDEISRNVKLTPGMVVTIEPGIYIPQDRHDVPKGFRGQGIRIEDDVLITPEGPHVLTAKCPKHPDDIEELLAERKL